MSDDEDFLFREHFTKKPSDIQKQAAYRALEALCENNTFWLFEENMNVALLDLKGENGYMKAAILMCEHLKGVTGQEHRLTKA